MWAQVLLTVGLEGRSMGHGKGEWGVRRGRQSPFAQYAADISLHEVLLYFACGVFMSVVEAKLKA